MMVIDQVERSSFLLKKIKDHIETRISELRKKNDNDLEEKETARMRGRLAELKELLRLLGDNDKKAAGQDGSNQ